MAAYAEIGDEATHGDREIDMYMQSQRDAWIRYGRRSFTYACTAWYRRTARSSRPRTYLPVAVGCGEPNFVQICGARASEKTWMPSMRTSAAAWTCLWVSQMVLGAGS